MISEIEVPNVIEARADVMSILAVGADHGFVAGCRLAYKVPEIPANKKLLVCENLPDSFLASRLVLTEAVVRCSEVDSDWCGCGQHVGEDRELFECGFFLSAR